MQSDPLIESSAGESPVPAIPLTLECLDVPVPPMLERAILGGMPLGSFPRFLGFFWLAPNQNVGFSDGAVSAIGDWRAWQRWRNHVSVAGPLLPYSFVHDGTPAAYWLMLDRVTRRVHAGRPDEVLAILSRQWRGGGPPTDATEHAVRILDHLLGQQDEIAANARLTPALSPDRNSHQNALRQAMEAWLNAHPKTFVASAAARASNWRNH